MKINTDNQIFNPKKNYLFDRFFKYFTNFINLIYVSDYKIYNLIEEIKK